MRVAAEEIHMLRRLFALIVVVGLVVVVLHYWKRDMVTGTPVRGAARDIGQEARAIGAEAKEKIVEVGSDLRDVKITGAVKTALSLNRSLNGYSINVSTDDHVVTLRGRVDRQDARTQIERLVAEVPDVHRVVNQIDIGPVETTTASGGSVEERAVAAQHALDANASLRGLALRVQVDGGRLVVVGQVRSAAERDLAGALAREAAGTPVENSVAVRPTAPTTTP
jgi:hyperosmotically inducible periplasmic protein